MEYVEKPQDEEIRANLKENIDLYDSEYKMKKM